MNIKEAIDVLERNCDFHHEETDKCYGCKFENSGWCDEDFHDSLLAMLKEQEAKPPIHVHEEYPEHDWKTNENGEVDEFAMNDGFHSGPYCKRCYHSFCSICNPFGFNDGPCVVDFFKCPNCGEKISNNTKFCDNCGQAVKWDD